MKCRVDFAHGARNRLRMACQTAARHYQAGHELLVYCTDQRRLQRFDQLLWSFDPGSFVPHCHADDPAAARAPVWLARDADALALALDARASRWLLNLDLDCPPDIQRFARILEIVSQHEADIAAARERWKKYQEAGLDLRSHDLAARSS